MGLKQAAILLALVAFRAHGAAQAWAVDDLWAWREASDPQISPDGRWVVFVEERRDRAADRFYRNLELVSAGGRTARSLTPGLWRDTLPRWSPDGSRIAYLSDRGGTTQIYVLRLDNGAGAQITTLERAPAAFAWSPDGGTIAFSAPEPVAAPAGWAPPSLLKNLLPGPELRLQIYTVPASGGEPRRLTAGSSDHHGALAWLPDGRRLLSSWSPDPRDALEEDEIYSIAGTGQMVTRLTRHPGPDEFPTPSPDGAKIAFLGHDRVPQSYAPRKLYVMNADGSRVRVLSGLLDRDVQPPQWSSDSRTLYFLADDRGAGHIYAARNDGTVRQVTSAAARLRGFSLSDGGVAATVRSTLAAAGEVVTLPVDVAAEPTTIAAVNRELLGGRDSGPVEEIRYSSDGNRIQGWLVKPPGFDSSQKYPLIVDALDGPGRMYGAEFNLRAQILAARGYVVLCANPRGSAGYGEQFGNLLPTRLPGDDYEDLMRGVDFVVSQGYLDPARLFLAGGLVAAWALGHTDRFAAAVVRRPIVDWTTDVSLQPDGAWRAARWLRALPWENPDQYMQRSPLYFARNFKTPALILAGDPDPESDELYFALRTQKVDSALARVSGTGRPSEQVAELEATLAWFGRFTR